MGTTKAGQTNIRIITKNTTGTYQISLPLELVRQLGWQQGQKVEVVKHGKTLAVRDWQA